MPSSLRKLFRDDIVFFVAGVIITAAVELAIEVPVQRYSSVFIAFVSLFIVYTMVTQKLLYDKVSQQLQQTGLTTLWLYEPSQSTESFTKALEIVRAAKYQVLVLSHYIPSGAPFDFPQARSDYLVRGLEKHLQARIEDPAMSKFTYSRIIQSDIADQANGVLGQHLMTGDVDTFEHCRRVYGMLKNQKPGNVDVELRISDPIHAMPSMMIVDDRYILFAMSTKPPKMTEGDKQVEFAGALIIEDRYGDSIPGFQGIYERLLQNSQVIDTVT